MTNRIVCWFSAGAASAVATKLAIEENNRGARLPLVVARCHIVEEHPDNERFAGFSAEEEHRLDRIIDANADMRLWPVLIERGLMHSDCLALVARAGIELPMMYKLGYKHNNCIGCVKAGAGYWNKIRVDFPATFQRMASLERKLGATINKDAQGNRQFLDELSPGAGHYQKEPEIQCGIFCEMAERELVAV
jgi:hypothetical protein